VQAATVRQTAEERRQAVLDAATHEFAVKGYHGASTEDIARAAGISQPYLFRLFGTKKKLFAEACRRCMRAVHVAMAEAAAGKSGQEALDAMGAAYIELLAANPRLLTLQMHMYAASDEPEIREVARDGFGELVRSVELTSGESGASVTRFFAQGMLINVIAAIGVRDAGIDWADQLMQGYRDEG
jgi:AcrR family transcriptional regulator